MNVQIIHQNNKPEWAVIPYREYLSLIERIEELQDIQEADRVRAAISRGEMELIPGEVVFAIMDGENPTKVWREYRALTQAQLAEKAGISIPYLSQLESGKRQGSVDVLSALAKALNTSLDMLVPRQPDEAE